MVATDILLYTKSYPDLVKTLLQVFSFKTKESPPVPFIMGWHRTVREQGRDVSLEFFEQCRNAGLDVETVGPKIYKIQVKYNT